MDYVILDAGPADAAAIATLHANSWRTAYRGILPDTFLDNELDHDRQMHWRERFAFAAPERPTVLKATDGTALLGFACVFLDHDDTWGALLDNLHVLPKLTGKSIGTALLHAARQRTAAASKARLQLWVFEANERARRFYERHGAMTVDRKIVEVIPGVHVSEVRYVFDVRAL